MGDAICWKRNNANMSFQEKSIVICENRSKIAITFLQF